MQRLAQFGAAFQEIAFALVASQFERSLLDCDPGQFCGVTFGGGLQFGLKVGDPA